MYLKIHASILGPSRSLYVYIQAATRRSAPALAERNPGPVLVQDFRIAWVRIFNKPAGLLRSPEGPLRVCILFFKIKFERASYNGSIMISKITGRCSIRLALV